MAEVLVGVCLAGCVILVASGITKLRDATDSQTAIRRVWTAAPGFAGRLLGAVEITVGLVGAVVGGVALWAVAGLYLALGGFALAMLRRGAAVPCGCFGARSAPVRGVHVAFDMGFALSAAAVAVRSSSPIEVADVGGVEAILFSVLTAVFAGLAYVVLTAWVELRDEIRQER